jgi:cytochrome c
MEQGCEAKVRPPTMVDAGSRSILRKMRMKISKLEKFAASILVVTWLVFGVNSIGNLLITAEPAASGAGGPARQAAVRPATEVPTGTAEPEQSAVALLANASADAGAKVFARCAACHTTTEGGANKVGPNLWDVVGADIGGHIPTFNYSTALTGKGGQWTYESLDHFLASPKDFAPGTRMTFAGVKRAQERADLLAYLRGLSPQPKPLP